VSVVIGNSSEALGVWTLGRLLLHVASGWKELAMVGNGLDGINASLWNRGPALRDAMRMEVPVPAAVWWELRRAAMAVPE
jgi:hypothetical protein